MLSQTKNKVYTFYIPHNFKQKLSDMAEQKLGKNMSDLGNIAIWNFLHLSEETIAKVISKIPKYTARKKPFGIRLANKVYQEINLLKRKSHTSGSDIIIAALLYFFMTAKFPVESDK